jgi:glycosyltransferase involved in cell wall biosynthesis
MITHSYYEEDPRVRREAEALVQSGRPVEVYALRRPGDERTGELDGVSIVRLDVQRHQGAGLPTYLAEYVAFLARAAWSVLRAHRRQEFALAQVHTLPDFLVLAALPLRWLGVPVILDLHEAMPEFFRSRFPSASSRPALFALRLQERLSIEAANAVLTVNDALADRLVALGTPRSKVTVIANSPALGRFNAGAYPARAFAQDGTVRLVYAGALSPIYELDVAIEAVARIRALRPDLDLVLDVYGRDFGEVSLADTARGLGIADRVIFHGRIPIDAVPAAIAAADIGLAPTRRNRFTDFSLSTKVFEYGAMGKPVIASRLPMVERTFDPDTVATYAPGEAEDLVSTILRLVDDPAERDTRVRRTAGRVAELAWEHEAVRYISLVESLAVDGLSSALAPRRAANDEAGGAGPQKEQR